MNRVTAYRRPALFSATLALGLVCASVAGAAPDTSSLPKITFSGYADADVVSNFGTDLSNPNHLSGMEVRLTTLVRFNPRLTAVVYTRFDDGVIPGQGAGTPFDTLNFDGAHVDWQYDDNTTLMAGDLLGGAGYFDYYRYKHTAAIVGEHSVRGVGFRRGGFEVHTGAALDSNSQHNAWSTYAFWDLPIKLPPGNTMIWTPVMKYTAGLPGVTPFDLGLSFKGHFESGLSIDAHFGLNYYDRTVDPGTVLLIEPSLVLDGYQLGNIPLDGYSFSACFFYNDKGDAPSENIPRQTLSGALLDDVLLYFEPDKAINKTFSVGLPLEYHNQKLDVNRDESFWVVPTLYIYPSGGRNAQWWLWARMTKPLIEGSGSKPYYAAGSEIILNF